MIATVWGCHLDFSKVACFFLLATRPKKETQNLLKSLFVCSKNLIKNKCLAKGYNTGTPEHIFARPDE